MHRILPIGLNARDVMRALTSTLYAVLLSTLLLVGGATAQTKEPVGLPDLIDRQLFFGNPEITGAQLSPDGEYLAFIKPWNGTLNVWVKRVDEPFEDARLLSTETRRPIGGYLWSLDSELVLYVKDNAGDENFNLYAVDPDAPTEPSEDAPPSRDLTGLEGVRVLLYSAPKNTPDVVYLGLNDRDPRWHDLYKLTLSTGELTLVRENTEQIGGWIFDLEGDLRLATRSAPNGDQEILRVDPDGLATIYSCDVFETCGPDRFHRDGERVYLRTNRGEEVDLIGLSLLNVATGAVELLESDPLGRVDLAGISFSSVTEELVVTSYREDRLRRYFRDPDAEADFAWLATQLPGTELRVGSRTLDERLWLVTAVSDIEPGEAYVFDRGAKAITFQYRIRDDLPRDALAPMQAIRYPSSDGLEIPAYLTLPTGVAPRDLPTLVIPHGGPWGRDVWGYHPVAQFFANRGYAVLRPNFRGSTGYGEAFLNAGNGEWGRLMQDDVTEGVRHLVAQGIADTERVGILGVSYGGYAVLAGVAFTPDVYRAAVDIVGPSNLVTLLNATPPYWESRRRMLFARMADLDTPEGRAWLEERSPLNAADRIKTPLLVWCV